MAFEWDTNKAATNLAKHDVSFDEAKTVFDDPLYIDFTTLITLMTNIAIS
jgi:uncharacterized DUF497 family protein